MEGNKGPGEEAVILVAVTGVICSGKSFVCKIIKGLGHPVFSCDEEIDKILKKNAVLKAVKRELPGAFIGERLDKLLLARIIFANKQAKGILERILYPELFLRHDEFIRARRKENKRVVFFEIPLLYEKELQDGYDFVITSRAPKNILLKRAKERDMDLKIFEKISRAQLPSEEKEKWADYVINTNATKGSVKKKVIEAIKGMLGGLRMKK